MHASIKFKIAWLALQWSSTYKKTHWVFQPPSHGAGRQIIKHFQPCKGCFSMQMFLRPRRPAKFQPLVSWQLCCRPRVSHSLIGRKKFTVSIHRFAFVNCHAMIQLVRAPASPDNWRGVALVVNILGGLVHHLWVFNLPSCARQACV
jgi:hypothetical protein